VVHAPNSRFVQCVSLATRTYATREYVPNSLDVHVWRNFSMHVKQSVQAIDTNYPHNVLLVLMC